MAMLQTPAQMKNNKLLKLPGQKTLAEAEDMTGQSTATTSPLTAMTMGASPMAAAMSASKAHTDKVAEGAAPERVRTQTADTVVAKKQAMLERGGGAVEKVTEQLSADVGRLGSIEKQVPAKALQKINETLLPQAPVIDKITITKDSPLAKTDPQIQQALLENRPVFQAQNGTITIGEAPKTQGSMLVTSGALSDMPNAPTQSTAAVHLAESGITDDEINKSLDPVSGISDFVKEKIPDQVKIDWLDEEDKAALARLGGDPEATHQELQDLSRKVQGKMAQVEQARAILLNNVASLEERAAAQRYLREQGFSGTLTVAQKANDLVAQIADNDKVTVGGKQMRIEEILSDEFIQGQVADMLSDPGLLNAAKKDPALAGLAEYVERNREAWDNLLKPVKSQLAGVKEVRERNKAQASFADGRAIPPELMDALMPGWKDLRKTGSLKVPPILELMQRAKNPVQTKALTDALTSALASKDVHPERWEALTNMTQQELAKSGILDGKVTWEQLEAAQTFREEAKAKVGATPVETTANFLGAQGASIMQQVQKVYKDLGAAGVDVTRLEDASYVETLPASIRGHIGELLKFNPDGSFKPEVIQELTDPGDFFGGGEQGAVLDVPGMRTQLESLAEAAASQATIKAGEQKLAEEAQKTQLKQEQVNFKGWDNGATAVMAEAGFPDIPMDYTKMQAWFNKLPPAKVQEILRSSGVDPRHPQALRALLDSKNGRYVLGTMLKTNGFVVDQNQLRQAITSDPKARDLYAQLQKAYSNKPPQSRMHSWKALVSKLSQELMRASGAWTPAVGNEAAFLRRTANNPGIWEIAADIAMKVPMNKTQQPPDAPTFT